MSYLILLFRAQMVVMMMMIATMTTVTMMMMMMMMMKERGREAKVYMQPIVWKIAWAQGHFRRMAQTQFQ